MQPSHSSTFLLAALLTILAAPAAFAAEETASTGGNGAVARAFTIAEPDLVPEGIAHDPSTGRFFIGSTYKRKIVSIAADGVVSTFVDAGDGILGPVGMRVDTGRNLLWVAHAAIGDDMPMLENSGLRYGLSRVSAFSLAKGERLYDFSLPVDKDSHFFNDLDVSANGVIYLSDTLGRAIYRLEPDHGEFVLLATLPEGEYPNGVTLSSDEETLYVARAGVPGAYRLDLASGVLTRLTWPEGMPLRADGLYFHDDALVAVQPWVEGCRVCRFTLDASGGDVTDHRPLAAGHDDFLQPTTGVIVDDVIYVIANSQLQKFRKLYLDNDGDYPLEQLDDIVVLRIAL